MLGSRRTAGPPAAGATEARGRGGRGRSGRGRRAARGAAWPWPGRPASRAPPGAEGRQTSLAPPPAHPAAFKTVTLGGRRLPPGSPLSPPAPRNRMEGEVPDPRCRTLGWPGGRPTPLRLPPCAQFLALARPGASSGRARPVNWEARPFPRAPAWDALREAAGARPRGFPLRRSALLRKCRPAPGETGVLHPAPSSQDQPDHNKGGARLAEGASRRSPPRPSRPSRHPHSTQADMPGGPRALPLGVPPTCLTAPRNGGFPKLLGLATGAHTRAVTSPASEGRYGAPGGWPTAQCAPTGGRSALGTEACAGPPGRCTPGGRAGTTAAR